MSQKDQQISSSGEIVFLESQAQYDSLLQKVAQLESQVKKLESNNQQIQKNFSMKERQYQQLIEEFSNYKKSEQEYVENRENSSLKLLHQFKIYEKQIKEQREMIKNLKEQNQKLLDENRELENQKDYLQSQNSVIDQEKQKIFISYYSRKKELEEVALEKNKFEEELKSYKEKIQNLEGQIETLQQKQIHQEQEISYLKKISEEKEKYLSKVQDDLKKYLEQEHIVKQPNQEEYKVKVIQNLRQIMQEIVGRFAHLSEELKDNENEKINRRSEEIAFLNKTFNVQLRLELEKIFITFKHEIRDNEVRE
ncbi:unnamed protein product (macronuclear) [Paramecium tetraurelia]|uniref:Uncharacterized protein n=1 Tax=Paramecium tetraurelia TaxID=5888 RepID=A0E5N4_PARTE|nr:uncharacterized protein GSPATT00003462001 [Paramecium tetraurelia]CAK90601.1 unnamed protein product [Paramecium tetraurelia]|eukprot:XP_001457998.1 hypothetical protein (macronuclear) [Paramecium tetraurelia strain d4-2]